METKSFDYENTYFEIRGQILYGKYKNVFISKEIAKTSVEQRKKVSNNKLYPLLIDARQVKGISKEARNHLSSDEGVELLSSAAILTDSQFTNFLANFLLNVNLTKTKIPLKLFNDEQKAIHWLKSFL